MKGRKKEAENTGREGGTRGQGTVLERMKVNKLER